MLPENPQYAEMRHGDVILTLHDVTDRSVASVLRGVQLFILYLSHGLVQVCEIELSHMGTNNGNLNLVCEKL